MMIDKDYPYFFIFLVKIANIVSIIEVQFYRTIIYLFLINPLIIINCSWSCISCKFDH